MTDYKRLKHLALAQPVKEWRSEEGEPSMMTGERMYYVIGPGGVSCWEHGAHDRVSASYIAAASPAVVLGLIAENERLTNRLEVDPRHDYDGISTRDATVKVLDEQVDQLKAENERLAKTADCWDRLNVQNKALSDSFRAERDQLKAENAGLKTGYEAYERVNAELKAENERLVAENTDIESAVITYIEDMQEAQYENERLKAEVDSLTREADRQYTTIEAYRRDVERFQWLLKNASVILDKKAAYQAENGFIKFDTMPGRTETELAIDAAMGKGEQS